MWKLKYECCHSASRFNCVNRNRLEFIFRHQFPLCHWLNVIMFSCQKHNFLNYICCCCLIMTSFSNARSWHLTKSTVAALPTCSHALLLFLWIAFEDMLHFVVLFFFHSVAWTHLHCANSSFVGFLIVRSKSRLS